jgi:hypothetical protein
MRGVSALFCVYSDSVFTKACLNGIKSCVDQIVIVEGSWDGPRGTYDYGENKRSDDGTRDIVEKFAAEHSNKVVLVDSVGDEECSRNFGLSLCTHDWVLHLDSDEFYWPHELNRLKINILEDLEANGIDRLKFPEYSFYFNFRHCFFGNKIRMFNKGLGITYFSANGVGDNLQGGLNKEVLVPSVSFAHFQWIGDRHKVLCTRNIEREKTYQRSMGQDPDKIIPMGGWRWWLNQVYLKFNGKNLKELEAKNMGSIHPWSFLHEDQRHHEMQQVQNQEMFPEHVRTAPWFNFAEEGLVTLNPDLEIS